MRFGIAENRLGWRARGARKSMVFSISHNKKFFYKLGDLCIGHPTFNALRERYADCAHFWLTRPELSGLTGAEAAIDEISADCLVVDGAPWHRHGREWLHSGLHPIDFIAQTVGVALDRRHRYIDVAIHADVRRRVKCRRLPARYAVIASGPCYTGGDWPFDDRQVVVNELLRHGIPCVSVGGRDSAALARTMDLCSQLTPIESIAVISDSCLYIGPDTGTTWLACAARDTPKVCVVDRGRKLDGVVGFEGFLIDENIRDVERQEGPDACLDAAWDLLQRTCNFAKM
ncbi:MAG: hypothetical protein U1F10_08585 [Burkholderiales bacterium]